MVGDAMGMADDKGEKGKGELCHGLEAYGDDTRGPIPPPRVYRYRHSNSNPIDSNCLPTTHRLSSIPPSTPPFDLLHRLLVRNPHLQT